MRNYKFKWRIGDVVTIKKGIGDGRFQCNQSQDGIEALEKVEAEIPDLVLLDLMLPRLNGFEVCQQLKQVEATSSITIIMLTAKSESSDKVE